MFPRIILGEHGPGVLSLPGSVSFSFLRLHLAFSLLLRHLAFSSNVFSITPFKCNAALSHRRRSQSRKEKKKKNWHPQPSWQPYNRWWPTTPRLYLCISPSAGCSAQLQFAFQTLIVPLRKQPYKMAPRSHLNKKKFKFTLLIQGFFCGRSVNGNFPVWNCLQLLGL